MGLKKVIFVAVAFVGCTVAGTSDAAPATSASIEKADMLREQGLIQDAKREYIDVIFGSDAKAKPEAYFALGNLAFREKAIQAAVSAWKELVARYPQSPQAALVKDRMAQLAEAVQEVSKLGADGAVAQSYLQHGDFYSDEKGAKNVIDTSWLPVVEMAVGWYDRAIKEFPKTSASRVAHGEKIKTLIGWKESGKYASSYGSYADMAKYMPRVEAAFRVFEAEQQDAPSLQALRFQIAQRYWRENERPAAIKWLQEIIEKAGTSPSFYSDLAKNRIANWRN